jgi:hypothetical protein
MDTAQIVSGIDGFQLVEFFEIASLGYVDQMLVDTPGVAFRLFVLRQFSHHDLGVVLIGVELCDRRWIDHHTLHTLSVPKQSAFSFD